VHAAPAKVRRDLLDPVEVSVVHGDRDTGHGLDATPAALPTGALG
jgi:hypothetical protein